MRADAQRNYDRLLEEATQAFMVHGTEVALEDIARHAGVGIGTLYRHFPDRYTLMNAVFEQEVVKINDRARELLDAPDPVEALTDWLRTVGVHSTAYRGLAHAIMSAPDAKMPACKTLLRSAGDTLLQRAKDAGAVRTDTTIGDLLKLTNAIVLTAENNRDDKGLFGRLMTLAVDGLRTRETAPATAG
ncbi:TetR/AcrR family transcriptional regulator [Actinacidiphila alni]|uniref:Transcriptional regulator, TetR family n=1 Tax=Actinacidiphila alni TaxID=380248 RepID=A0A1I2DT51_9ACTN|nr:TetR/AcrR family transcriptional regulator [Actinacidiphila alni]SFE83696.1 transcriptional regulator, TetR family [Actinacidiphila alni]